jgi:DNA-binding response OmpR family regulator
VESSAPTRCLPIGDTMLRDSQPPWNGGNVLVAEDNFLLAEVVCDFLQECNLMPVGPAGRVDEASRLARERPLDGAVLDLKLGNHFCFPICGILSGRRIPFIFLTGYGERAPIPLEFGAAPVVGKPFEVREMKVALVAMLGRREGLSFADPSSVACGL